MAAAALVGLSFRTVLPVQADQDVAQHGVVGKYAGALKGAGEAEPRYLMRLEAV